MTESTAKQCRATAHEIRQLAQQTTVAPARAEAARQRASKNGWRRASGDPMEIAAARPLPWPLVRVVALGRCLQPGSDRASLRPS